MLVVNNDIKILLIAPSLEVREQIKKKHGANLTLIQSVVNKDIKILLIALSFGSPRAKKQKHGASFTWIQSVVNNDIKILLIDLRSQGANITKTWRREALHTND